MTIIKQTGVQSSGHMKNLRGYINDDRKVILRDSLNMDGCTNPKRWAHHMWILILLAVAQLLHQLGGRIA